MTEERVARVARLLFDTANQPAPSLDGLWEGLNPRARESWFVSARAVIAHLEAEFEARLAGAVEKIDQQLNHMPEGSIAWHLAEEALAHLRGISPAPECPRCAEWETVAASPSPMPMKADLLLDYWMPGPGRQDEVGVTLDVGDEWRVQKKVRSGASGEEVAG